MQSICLCNRGNYYEKLHYVKLFFLHGNKNILKSVVKVGEIRRLSVVYGDIHDSMSSQKYSAIEYALKYLNTIPKSERDIQVLMYKKGYSEKEVVVACKKLKEIGFLGDELFVKLYIDSEVIKKGKPLIVAKKHLFEKGISKHLVETYCSEHREAIREGMIERIKTEIEKYKKQGFDGIDIIQKIVRKGYPIGYVKEIAKRKQEQGE